MARVISTVFVLALLAATALAFALTEGAKLERSPIFGTRVAKVFSPECRCTKSEALISFKLRKSQTLTAWVERDGERARTLVSDRRYPAGRVDLYFDGHADDGTSLPDGIYRPVVHLVSSHRTIALPNPIRLDTKPPVIRVPHPLHAVISPDGDGHKDLFRVVYTVNEPAHAMLFVNGTAPGKRVLYTLRQPLRGTLVWNGRIGGKPARPRNYVLYASARDTAGNEAKPIPFAVVQVRYVALGRKRIVARPGGRFALRVSTDAPRVQWLLNGRTGTARRGTLHLRAPRSQGVYKLYVTAAGHSAVATVVVA